MTVKKQYTTGRLLALRLELSALVTPLLRSNAALTRIRAANGGLARLLDCRIGGAA